MTLAMGFFSEATFFLFSVREASLMVFFLAVLTDFLAFDFFFPFVFCERPLSTWTKLASLLSLYRSVLQRTARMASLEDKALTAAIAVWPVSRTLSTTMGTMFSERGRFKWNMMWMPSGFSSFFLAWYRGMCLLPVSTSSVSMWSLVPIASHKSFVYPAVPSCPGTGIRTHCLPAATWAIMGDIISAALLILSALPDFKPWASGLIVLSYCEKETKGNGSCPCPLVVLSESDCTSGRAIWVLSESLLRSELGVIEVDGIAPLARA